MFTFNNINILSGHDRDVFLKNADTDTLILALQGYEMDTLAEALAERMEEPAASAFRKKREAAGATAASTADDEKETDLSDADAVPAEVTAAREQLLALVMSLSERGEITLPEVIYPGASSCFKDRLRRNMANTIIGSLEYTQAFRAQFRKLVLEQAESLDKDGRQRVAKALGGYGEEKDMEAVSHAIERELDDFIDGIIGRHCFADGDDGSLHDALMELGDERRRRIKAHLILEHEDFLLRQMDEKLIRFDDITRLDARSVQRLLREVDQQDLELALKLADRTVQDTVFRNVSKRLQVLLKENIEFMGPVRKQDVYAAQDKIIALMQRLEKEGDIVLPDDAGDEIVD